MIFILMKTVLYIDWFQNKKELTGQHISYFKVGGEDKEEIIEGDPYYG